MKFVSIAHILRDSYIIAKIFRDNGNLKTGSTFSY